MILDILHIVALVLAVVAWLASLHLLAKSEIPRHAADAPKLRVLAACRLLMMIGWALLAIAFRGRPTSWSAGMDGMLHASMRGRTGSFSTRPDTVKDLPRLGFHRHQQERHEPAR